MKPVLIHNLDFANKKLEISGEVEVNSCDRLADLLSDTAQNSAKIHYQLTGATQKLSLPSLHLNINATLPVLCQRCLDVMQLDFALQFNYVVSANPPTEAEESDDIDWLETDFEMNVNALIEDELLIAMPIAPKHQNGCKPSNTQSGEKPNPFAVLKDLVKK